MADAFTTEEEQLAPAVVVATALLAAALALGVLYRVVLAVL